MSESGFKDNIPAIIEAFKKKREKMLLALRSGFRGGLEVFQRDELIKKQLRGRKSADYGLNVRTGNALRSLSTNVAYQERDLIGKISVAANAWYLKVHEHYKFNGYVKKKNGGTFYIRKRIYFYETFRKTGPSVIRKELMRKLVEAANAR